MSYEPSRAIKITGETGVRVTVVNDFSGIEISKGRLAFKKVVESTTATESPVVWVIEYGCTDGTAGSVSLPRVGGISDPAPITVGAFCSILESGTMIPPGWTVTYRYQGATTPDPPTVTIPPGDIQITVVNTAPGPAPAPTTAPLPDRDTAGGTLAESGPADPIPWIGLAALFTAIGLLLRNTSSSARH